MAEHHRKKTPKLLEYWRAKAKRQYEAHGALRRQQMAQNYTVNRRDVGAQMYKIFNAARHRAAENGREFTIDKDWVAAQPRMCAISGIPFEMRDHERGPLAPSLDRKDSSKGYTPENCQFVCCFYNLGKNTWEDEEIQDLILLYAEAIKKRRGMA